MFYNHFPIHGHLSDTDIYIYYALSVGYNVKRDYGSILRKCEGN